MRNAFADEVTKLAQIDERVVLLSGDIGNKLFDEFKQVAPHRFYNCGVAEANMMGVAAGMALSGFRPIIYTITPFTTTRCFEQIRVDVCYQQAPVIIVGTGSGLSYTELGPTHHSLEDMAILRTLPGMQVFAPCDSIELRFGLRQALQQPQPLYMRIGKKGEPKIHHDHALNEMQFQLGKAICLKASDKLPVDVTWLAAGTIMPEVLAAAKIIESKGWATEVSSFHTIKPLDVPYLQSVCNRSKLLVTVEEHGLIGGLGSAIAEWLVTQNKPNKSNKQTGQLPAVINMGTPDEFLHEIGTQQFAREKYGLVAADMAARVDDALKKL